MHVLVLCDDYWHPARIIRSGLAPLEQTDITFEWIENAADWSEERMIPFPLVILAKSNNMSSTDQSEWVTDETEAAFLRYLQNGGGLLVIHSGSAGYEKRPVFRRMIGGAFRNHPEQCLVTVDARAGHFLDDGYPPFTSLDEHYVMDLDDMQADVFLTTRSQHGEQPGGWIRRENAGRVCVLTPGHNLEVWLHPTYQKLIHNALRWCSGQSE